MRETGTGQQVAQLHERLMMMMMICNLDTFAEGHRHNPKGMKVNKKIICKTEKV